MGVTRADRLNTTYRLETTGRQPRLAADITAKKKNNRRLPFEKFSRQVRSPSAAPYHSTRLIARRRQSARFALSDLTEDVPSPACEAIGRRVSHVMHLPQLRGLPGFSHLAIYLAFLASNELQDYAIRGATTEVFPFERSSLQSDLEHDWSSRVLRALRAIGQRTICARPSRL